MNRFTKYALENSGVVTTPLPLMHTTDAKGFREVVERCKLETNRCTVFGDHLLYLFYGRPAYRVNSGVEATSISHNFPVCFLLKAGSVRFAKRVYPFDSGAFAGNLFGSHIGDLPLDSFLVDPDPSALGRVPIPETPSCIVSAFFGNNKGYYWGTPEKNTGPGPLEFEAQCYLDLISSKAETHYDDRRGSIEVQLEYPIGLSSDTVQAIVLPGAFLEDDSVKRTILVDWKAIPLTYGTYHTNPSTFVGVVIEKVAGFLESNGMI